MSCSVHNPFTSTHPDSDFGTMDLALIHDLLKQPLFNSLRSVFVLVWHDRAGRDCDTVLTAEKMERRIRLILEPWHKRGILTAKGHDEYEVNKQLLSYRRVAAEKGVAVDVDDNNMQSTMGSDAESEEAEGAVVECAAEENSEDAGDGSESDA